MKSSEAVISRPRLDTVDFLRGIVMILMLLDHTRDFLHITRTVDPAQLATTTVPLFLTRFVTHFCAPIFVLLAGMGVRLQLLGGKSYGHVSQFLLTRGLWLIILELTVIRFGFAFSLNYMAFGGMLQIIWVLGIGMILLSGLIHLPVSWVAALGVVIVFGSNLLDGISVGSPPGKELGDILFMLLHAPGFIQPFGENAPSFLVLYPLLPWIGLLFLGYVVAGVYKDFGSKDFGSDESGFNESQGVDRRRKILFGLAVITLLLFVALRSGNFYGDPSPWGVQARGPVFTALSFFNVTKYPVSLLYILLMTSPAFAILAAGEKWYFSGGWKRVCVIFGRVPLFFYILQWFAAHGAGEILMKVFNRPEGMGLVAVYITWIVLTILLYFPCRWFADVKRRNKSWWLSYL